MIIRCEAEGSRKRRLIMPTSLGFFGRSISEWFSTYRVCLQSKLHVPSMSAGWSKSIRRMRPVERAIIRTLLATSAATKSEDMENCSDTRSMLNMGSDAFSSSPGAYPDAVSNAMNSDLFEKASHGLCIMDNSVYACWSRCRKVSSWRCWSSCGVQ